MTNNFIKIYLRPTKNWDCLVGSKNRDPNGAEGETLSNLSSCQGSGYHTPIDDDDEDDEDYNENVQVRAPLEVPSNYSTIKSNISSAPSLLPTQVAIQNTYSIPSSTKTTNQIVNRFQHQHRLQ